MYISSALEAGRGGEEEEEEDDKEGGKWVPRGDGG